MISIKKAAGVGTSKELRAICKVTDALHTGMSIPYMVGGPMGLEGIAGNIGMYLGFRYVDFVESCPIDIKLAYLCVFAAGFWNVPKSNANHAEFMVPSYADSYKMWDLVKKAYRKKQNIYITKVDYSELFKSNKITSKHPIVLRPQRNHCDYDLVVTRVGTMNADDLSEKESHLYVMKHDVNKCITINVDYCRSGVEKMFAVPTDIEYYFIRINTLVNTTFISTDYCIHKTTCHDVDACHYSDRYMKLEKLENSLLEKGYVKLG